MNRLDGKVALITGGARGQGAVEAGQFVDAGARVIITDILDAEGAAVAERIGPNCSYRHHDVSSESDWASVIDEISNDHGRLDVLVNNAGITGGGGYMMDTTLDVWNTVVAVNQTGVFLGMVAAAPLMTSSGGGSIINISSIAGIKSAARAHAYGATKWAVRGMTKSAAVELGPQGIRVNSVHPGLIDTTMLDNLDDEARQAMFARLPIKRLGEPDDVGRLVLFLASDDSAYCTGQEFLIDGGLTS